MNKRIIYLRRLVALALITFVWVNSGNLFAQNHSSAAQSSLAEVTNFPFIETFETNSPTFDDWTQTIGVGTEIWNFAEGAGGGSITTAYEGTRNARFISNGNYGYRARLISPVLNLSTITSPKLSFYLGQESWQGEQNTTKVFYRTSTSGPWVELANYTADIDEWTLFEITLPNKSSTYQVSFEGTNNYGRANVIDLVKVFEGAPPATVTSFPFTETFETSSATLTDWRQIHEVGTGNWTYATGAGNGGIITAFEGTSNARFISNSNLGYKTKLVSPPLDLSGISSPKLSFYIGQQEWQGDQNITKVFYRTSVTASWIELAHYNGDIGSWVQFEITLPNKSATYQIAFEGTNYYGFANVIDLVKVYENATPATVTSFPFTETFETSSATLTDWRQIHEVGAGNWTYATGAGNGGIITAFEGTRNARFISNSNLGHKTKLVTPPLNLSGISSPKLSFYIGQQDWQGDQNTTKVFYRTSATASWVQLAHYTGDIGSWTQFELTLPNKSATYQIAFEGTNNHGFANVIDLVKVYDSDPPPVVVTDFPFIESFETNSPTLADWRQTMGVGYGVDFWSFATGAGGGSITTAWEGTRNARFVSNSNYGNSAYLISPVLNLTGITSPKLSFFLGQESWQGEQNTTKVFYRTSATASWVQLAHYTNDIITWTQFELTLPNPSATYQIAFEGINNYGRANVIDLVKVFEGATPATVTSFPFTETFETSSATLTDWRQIHEVGTGNWTYATGAGNGGIITAFEGTRNARFISNSNLGHKTKLVTPPLDLSGISSPKLSFYIGQQDWQGDQNTTKVFYRTSATASWVELAHYTGDIGSWTQFELNLPNKSATYQIAFEGTNNHGFANVIDLVKVYEDVMPLPVAVTNVAPLDGTINVNNGMMLNWIFGNYTNEYELVMSTTNPPATVVVPYTSTLATSYALSGLLPNTTYFWRVNAANATGTTLGPIWSFTTALAPTPDPVNNITPMNGAINIDNGMALHWAFGANTSEYQLLMGTSYPPSVVFVPYTSNLATTYTLFGLEYNKTYYWQVNAKNSVGTTPGPIWSFTTKVNVGIDNPEVTEAIQVYAQGNLIYLVTASRETALVNVYNLTGKLVLQGNTNGDTHSTINASTLSNGIYVVNVVQNNGVIISRKVSIQR
jgi:hypothetical protein